MQHSLRSWLGTKYVPCHYPKQCGPSFISHIYVTGSGTINDLQSTKEVWYIKDSDKRWHGETIGLHYWQCQFWPVDSLHLTGLRVKWYQFNTLRPRQNGRHFPDDIFKCIFLNENGRISIKFSLKFVPKVPINNIPALVQIMAWCRPGDKPLSEPMTVSLLTHICVTRPQWVKRYQARPF